MNSVSKYFLLWKKLTVTSFMSVVTSRLSTLLFLFGKSLRFTLFGIFLIVLFSKTTTIGQYSLVQALFFYLTFNVLDTLTQLLFREVYRFRQLVVTGDFDFVLVKPMSPLFRALVGGADLLDVIMLMPYISILIYVGTLIKNITLWHIGMYIVLLVSAFFIAMSFHILVLALGILTTEIDHTIMMYRDIASMGRLPVDIYKEPVRSLVTFVIPIGIMMTFPARALFGLLSWQSLLIALGIAMLFYFLSLRVWRSALSHYQSASS